MTPHLKTTTTVLALVAAFATAFASSPALAEHAEKCDPLPKDEWRPQAELERKLANQGWRVGRVVVTNGCYEVYGHDEKGRKVETFFHPKTLAVVTAAK